VQECRSAKVWGEDYVTGNVAASTNGRVLIGDAGTEGDRWDFSDGHESAAAVESDQVWKRWLSSKSILPTPDNSLD
jgi:hypothetical protein